MQCIKCNKHPPLLGTRAEKAGSAEKERPSPKKNNKKAPHASMDATVHRYGKTAYKAPEKGVLGAMCGYAPYQPAGSRNHCAVLTVFDRIPLLYVNRI